MSATTLPNLLSVYDVTLWLGLPTCRVARLARGGRIPAIQLPGGDLAFDEAELVAWLEGLRGRHPCP